ncbi:quaternary amine ABC transporter ATP-binding protein [Hohaiivirga grylli]
MSLIEIKNLTTIFGKNPKAALEKLSDNSNKQQMLAETNHVLALNNISLTIEAGEIFVIMGLSGSGKSTLVRHINRLIDPTAGSVLIDGVDIVGLSRKELLELRRKRIAMVFQRFGLMPHYTVLENVAYGLQIQGVKSSERLDAAKQWLERVGLAGYENQYPEQLSGGMQQRVGLARALASDTDIILMDEAFSALDPLIRSELQDEVVNLQNTLGKTIVFITHDLDEALRLADRIAILKDGNLIQVGTPNDILLNPADAYVEAFVRDVNRARALTVDTLMQPPELRLTAETIGGALAQMRRAQTDIGYLVDDGKYAGVVTRDALEEAIKEHGAGHATSEVADETHAIAQDTAIENALQTMLDSEHPVAIVTEEGELAGVINQQDVGEILAVSDKDEKSEEKEA